MIKETAQDQKYDKILGAITNLETKVIAPIQTELAVTVKRVDLLENSRAKRKHNSDETSFNTSNGGSNK